MVQGVDLVKNGSQSVSASYGVSQSGGFGNQVFRSGLFEGLSYSFTQLGWSVWMLAELEEARVRTTLQDEVKVNLYTVSRACVESIFNQLIKSNNVRAYQLSP